MLSAVLMDLFNNGVINHNQIPSSSGEQSTEQTYPKISTIVIIADFLAALM
jgi:hypothetical protein